MVLLLLRNNQLKAITRSLSCTSGLQSKQWRLSKGLSANRTAEGILTDAPDYTFLDGRPTPLLQKQKLRMLKQQENAKIIVQLTSEVNFAKQRYQDNLQAEREEKERILKDRLKPKGKLLKN